MADLTTPASCCGEPTTDAAGNIEIRPTHRVHEHAGSAIVRARKPA
jgi:hypothetical protein